MSDRPIPDRPTSLPPTRLIAPAPVWTREARFLGLLWAQLVLAFQATRLLNTTGATRRSAERLKAMYCPEQADMEGPKSSQTPEQPGTVYRL